MIMLAELDEPGGAILFNNFLSTAKASQRKFSKPSAPPNRMLAGMNHQRSPIFLPIRYIRAVPAAILTIRAPLRVTRFITSRPV